MNIILENIAFRTDAKYLSLPPFPHPAVHFNPCKSMLRAMDLFSGGGVWECKTSW